MNIFKKNYLGIFISLLIIFAYAPVYADQVNGRVETCRNFNAEKYILGPNDVINISVYDSPEFDQKEVRVQPDGKIVINPLGAYYVSGMTIDELKYHLVKRLKIYLNNPYVSIILVESKPFIVYVTGAVIKPGSYEVTTNYKSNSSMAKEVTIERKTPLLTNILTTAGGVAYDADIEHIQIANSITNTKQEVNLYELLKNGDSSQDIYLVAGDVINVPKLPSPLVVDINKYKEFSRSTFFQDKIPVKVYGYVNNPGLVQLDPSQSSNINSAIMSAGGYLKDSAYAPKKVYISRIDTSGKIVTKIVNPMENDLVVLPNDIIYVPEKSRPLLGKCFDYMARVFMPFNVMANTYNNWSLMFDPTRYQVIGK